MHPDKSLLTRTREAIFGDGKSINNLEIKYAGGINFDTVSAGWYLRNGYPQIYSILTGGMPAWSGEAVSVETALNHSVVWACNKIISESIGFIPANLMIRKGDNSQVAQDHPMFNAMRMAPNSEITAQTFSETKTSHTLLVGNAYSKIERRSGTGTAVNLNLLLPQQVFPDRERDGARRLVYVVKQQGSADKTYTVIDGRPHDIFHIRGLGWDGIRGYSVITMGRQSIGTAIAEERNIARFWAAGGRVPYYLKLAKKFRTDTDAQKFRDDWERMAAEPNRVPIVDPSEFELIQTAMKMTDAQALESRAFTIAEICRWFNLSPHLAGDLSRATFSNIEHLFLEFKQMTLQTWINRWEQEFWRCVLTDDEKSQGYFLRHNVDELQRGDFKTRMEGFASALQNGHMNIDEVRSIEGRNKLPNNAGEAYHIQLNMAPVENINQEPDPTAPTVKPMKSFTDWLRRIA
jgi:HK97 family phage portal protein